MVTPLMPKATAVWLIQNTSLTFEQIADFCGVHVLEVQSIADGEVAKNIRAVNPIEIGQLTKNEITRCENNPKAILTITESMRQIILEEQKKSAKKYIPIAKRNDKLNAIAWIIKNCPEINDIQIAKLIGTTKKTILSIKNKSHWNYSNIKFQDPVILGLCSQSELNRVYDMALADAKK